MQPNTKTSLITSSFRLILRSFLKVWIFFLIELTYGFVNQFNGLHKTKKKKNPQKKLNRNTT